MKRCTLAMTLALPPLMLTTGARAAGSSDATQVTVVNEGPSSPRSEPTRLEDRTLVFPTLGGLAFTTFASPSVDTLRSESGLSFAAGPISFRSIEGQLESSRRIAFAPSADVILGRTWTLGGTLRASWTTTRSSGSASLVETTSNQLGIAPRVGYLIPLGGGVTFWPQVGGTVTYGSFETSAEGLAPELRPSSRPLLTLGLSARASFVFPLTRYVFVRLTPGAGVDFAQVGENGPTTTTVSFGTDAALGLAF